MSPTRKDSGPSGSLLREVTRLYARAQRAAADCCGTSPTQCQVITELGRTGPISMVELGRRLCLEKSWISRAIEGLVDDGLVTKAINPADSRSWLVSLSAAGRRRLKALDEQIEGHARRVLAHVPASQRTVVQQSLMLLLAALRQDAGLDATEGAACCAPRHARRQARGQASEGARHVTSE
ncbi:MAG: winged helix-turn-helix transcriptional regulator [Burkholderiales bacterium]|jgi:DNA-binding MarR family transcriptional regulator|nr:winged helix-turn-helix transcriptional regulator [Burkholderiales bacterium]